MRSLPKFFSCANKSKYKALTLLDMHDKISPAEFRTIFSELTNDVSIANSFNPKAVDECIKLIMSTVDESILRDIQVNNCWAGLFDTFLDIAEKNIEELLTAAVDNHRHAQVT